MSIPLARAKALCTDSELAVIRASRPPQIRALSLAEARKLAKRARGMFDKQQQLGRQQGRKKAKSGVGQAGTATATKQQLFREALDALETRVRKLADSDAAPSPSTPARKSSRQRTAAHREERARTKKQLTDKVESGDTGATPKAVASVEPETKSSASKKPSRRKTTPASSLGKARSPVSGLKDDKRDAKRQLRASTAAKQTRIAKSGQTTRLKGHVSARGKRSQARRDKR